MQQNEASSSDQDENPVFSRSANPSVETLTLGELSQSHPEEFTDQYLTLNGEGKIPTNTGKKVLGLQGLATPTAHISDAIEYAKTSRLFRAMNVFGGSPENQRIIKRLEQIVGDGTKRTFIPIAEQKSNITSSPQQIEKPSTAHALLRRSARFDASADGSFGTLWRDPTAGSNTQGKSSDQGRGGSR